ncbi:MAG: WD40/YVTN/BNR-like repeat-containing protein, partial [Acidobacteriota bacterium]
MDRLSFAAFAVLLLLASDLPAQINGDDLSGSFRWRNIGPAAMMGRVSSIDALNDDYRTVLIGSASGGVFKSTNAGNTWTAIFDSYGSQSIGDVAFFQGNPDIIWVGTGEATNRNSVGWGDGIYKSTDGGKTFTNMGLGETHQISEILTHPSDPKIVYVAALGHLWGYSGTRGLYKTIDGGETWEKLTNGLPNDGRTGATVVTMHPDNPDILFAGMYHRLRTSYSMYSGGPNGGIYKSTDAGTTWKKLTDGLPTGETGQIDISIYRKNPDIIWAYVEASDELPHDLSAPGPGVYRSDDGGESWTYVLRHNS